MSGKVSMYILILKSFLVTALAASDTKAQYKSVHEVVVKLNLKDASVKTVLDHIEKQTDYLFQYYKRDIPDDVKIDVKSSKISVGEVLYSVSSKTNLKFRQVNNSIAIAKRKKREREFVKVVDEVTVSGKILDENGDPLPGVTVIAKGTTTGTVTDIDGNYTITVEDDAILVFSFIGFASQEISVAGKTVIDVSLLPDATLLNEVIVTGYGVERRLEITGAIASVKGSEIEAIPLQSFDRAIQGRAAGVLVQSSFGVPGSAISVKIRGTGSINAGTDPLFIIDGIQMNTRDDAAAGVSQNPLAGINPSDIESIEILKDAASTSIYGSQAANGVVIITTKRGKAGKTRFNLHVYTGITEIINEMDMMSAQEYINWRLLQQRYSRSGGTGEPTGTNEGVSRREALRGFDDTDWAPLGLSNTDLGAIPQTDFDAFVNSIPSYNWQDILFSRGSTTNAELSASGGNDKTRFFISGGISQQESQVEGVDFQRVAFRSNIDHDVTDKITLSTSLNLSTVEQNGVNLNAWSFNNPVFGSIAILPFNGPNDEDGVFHDNNNRFRTGRVPHSTQANLMFDEREVQTVQIVGNFAINYKITNDLKFRSFYGIDWRNVDSFQWSDPRTSDGGRVNGRTFVDVEKNFNWITTQTLNYSKQLTSSSRLDALLGFEFREEKNEKSEVTVVGFPDPALRTIQSGSEATNFGGFFSTWKLGSYFANVKYGLSEKYFVTATARYDGSSRFGANKRFGFFPAVGAAWVISEEPFMGSFNFLDELKLRASVGVTGNQAIGNFDSRGLVSSAGAGIYGQTAGLNHSGLANEDLTWEEQTTINLGMDYSILRSRITGTFEVYKRRSKELLLEKNLPRTSGHASFDINGGEVENKGLEISLNTVNVRFQGFEWRTSFNISFVENELIELLDGATNDGDQYIVGEPLDVWYLFRYAGANPANGRPMFYDRNGNITYDPQITGVGNEDDDRVAVDDSNSNFFGGFGNTFSYKGLKLDVFFNYDIGKTIYDRQAYLMYNSGEERQYNYYRDTPNQAWLEPGDVKPFGSPSRTRVSVDTRGSDLFLADVSFIRLKTISLSYDLPQKLIGNIGFTNANIYATATNPFTWTGYTGYDPESSARGGNSTTNAGGNGVVGRFPGSKIYTFGFKVGF